MDSEPTVVRQAGEDGDVRDTWADVNWARESMGYQPKTTFAAGIAQEYTWIAEKIEGSDGSL